MWFAKVLRYDATSNELEVMHFLESDQLRSVYHGALADCRAEDCAQALIYSGPVRKIDEALAEYVIAKGSLGGILVGRSTTYKRKGNLVTVRENRKESK